jgi:regulator of sigma E protease
VAKWCNVKVLRFSVGFGKIIYAKRSRDGETEWALSAIPLGGYVKMLDEREGEVAEQELPRAFNRQPVLRRMAIVIAGPLANLILAVLMYWGLFVYGVPGIKPTLGEIPLATPAAQVSLRPHSTILAINGKATPSWQEVRWVLLDLAMQKQAARLNLVDESGEPYQQMLETSSLAPADLDGDFLQKLGLQLFQPPIYPVIDKVIEGSVSQRVGLQAGDRILSVDGQAMVLWDNFVEAVRSHPAQLIKLVVEREGHQISLDIIPEAVTDSGKSIGRIGAAPHIDHTAFNAQMIKVQYPPIAALTEAFKKTWETSWISLKMMGKMVVGEVSLKNLSGPITIADYAGQSAQIGLGAYISFLALISISLGVLNLLPVPLLDGGHLLYYAIELVKGSPVPEKLWEVGQKLGIALLITMMACALFNDVSRLISG